jgi:hypothetical protein
MAIYSQATDLATKQTIWVSRNVVKNRSQLNSHREDMIGKSLQRCRRLMDSLLLNLQTFPLTMKVGSMINPNTGAIQRQKTSHSLSDHDYTTVHESL